MMNRQIAMLTVLAIACAISACSDDDKNNANSTNNTNSVNSTNNTNNTNNMADAGNNAVDMPPPEADRACDSLDPSYCTLPFPSHVFLAEDENRETGVTLTFGPEALPSNVNGTHIDPTPYRRMDGYGLGAPAIALFPNVDSSGLPDEYNVGDSMNDDANVVLLEVGDTVRKVAYYVDHDLQTDDPTKRTLIVRPAEILKPATRYIVAFRNLVDTDGEAIPAGGAFQNLVDGTTGQEANLFWRQARFDDIFAILDAQGWSKDTLTLAWDWNTASEDALHGYMLHMREDAFTTAGAMGPELTITEVEEFDTMQNEDTRYRMRGTFEVPNYIAEDSGRKFLNLGDDGMPEASGTRTVDFWVNVPHSAVGGNPHELVLYGHGLFGTGERAWASFNSRVANNNDLIYFGASLWGMAEFQADNDAVPSVTDLSLFPNIGDQLYQGMIEWLLLTRAMKNRFADLQEVTDRTIQVGSDNVYYSGISQGGIFGPTFVALSPEVQYGHAGVPGHTYAMLLHRSVDFAPFFTFLRLAYDDVVEQLIGLHTIQLLWDGTDSVSYFRKLSADPFDAGDTNAMIFAPAKGDFQVAVVQNEILARTPDLGIAVMANYDLERTIDLATETAYPHTGSAVVLYDFEETYMSNQFRNSWPVPGNLPPVRGDEMCAAECPVGENIARAKYECCAGECCFDAHELPRRRDWHNDQMVHFFKNGGEVIDVCGGDGCTPD